MTDAAEQLRRFLGKEKSHIDDPTPTEPVEELDAADLKAELEDEIVSPEQLDEEIAAANDPVPAPEVASSDDED